MTGDTKLQQLLTLLRGCGALMIVAASGTFLVQSWGGAGDVKRYLALLGTTVLLPVVAYVCGIRFRESRSARVLVMTILALVPIHAGVLGGFVLSQFGEASQSLASVAQWIAPSRAAALLLAGGAAAVLLPLAWASFRVLSRRHARLLTASTAVSHALLLIPSRSAAAATFTLVLMLSIAAWAARQAAPQTREAKLAVVSLLAPAAVITARQLLFYDVTTAFWAAVMAAFATALVAFGRQTGDVTVERLAVVPLFIAMGALFDQTLWRLDWAPDTEALSFGWATGAVLVALGATSSRSVRFFVLAAVGLNAFIAAVVLVLDASAWAALQSMAVGLALLSYGFVANRRIATVAGMGLAGSGFVVELIVAIRSFEPSGWLALSGFGALLVGLTAWLERRARALPDADPNAKVSPNARSPLPR